MKVDNKNKPVGGALVYIDDVLCYNVVEADDAAGYVISFATEWDEDEKRWLKVLDSDNTPITIRREGNIRILSFDYVNDLRAHTNAYHAGLEDGRAAKANWGGALYTYKYALRDAYDIGYRAAMKGA